MSQYRAAVVPSQQSPRPRAVVRAVTPAAQWTDIGDQTPSLHRPLTGLVGADPARHIADHGPGQEAAPAHRSGLGMLAAAFRAPAAPDVVLARDPRTVAVASTGRALATGHQTGGRAGQAVYADLVHEQTHDVGRGITVGILSDSFNLLGGMATDQANVDLPRGVSILKEGGSGHDEGRAMAEIVRSIAPSARIDFYSATGGEQSFADGIHTLAAAGCQVIVDDVAYLDEPFFQDGGIVQKAVEDVVAGGVSYFTAASNEGSNYYQHAFSGMRAVLPGLLGVWTANNFGGQTAPSATVALTIPRNAASTIDLQWDQPYASIGHGPGASSSLALALFTADGRLVATAGGNQVQQDPRQILQFVNTTNTTSFRLAVLSNGGVTPPDQFKFIIYGAGTIQDPQAGIGSGTVIGHELIAGANTVGAVAWNQTTRFGGTNTVENFSSVGSGQVLFDSHGDRLASPITTQKVNFLAPDGDTTSVFAPFYGTSAAAPAAAGVAALVLAADPLLTPTQVSNVLACTAQAAHGPAGSVGAGLIDAHTAVALATQLYQQSLHHA